LDSKLSDHKPIAITIRIPDAHIVYKGDRKLEIIDKE